MSGFRMGLMGGWRVGKIGLGGWARLGLMGRIKVAKGALGECAWQVSKCGPHGLIKGGHGWDEWWQG